MHTQSHYKSFFRLILAISLLVLFFSINHPVWAETDQPQQTGGLQVTGAILQLQATPGMVYVHHMTVEVGAQAPALDVTVQALGLGQALDGSPQILSKDQDTSPYSALTYITNISQTSFHLQPGGSMSVDATLTIPSDFGKDSRFAAIYIKGTPANSGANVTQILSVIVPIIIIPQNGQLNATGQITDLKVDPVEAGKPITITTTVKNTGNELFKVKGDVKILDPSGQLVTDLQIPLTSNSIVPTFTRELVSSYSALEKSAGLAAGTYTANVVLTKEDGTSLDSKQVKFEISKTYRPFPEIDDQHILIKCFQNEEPGEIDARQKTDVKLTFEGTGKVTGCVAVGKYTQEPSGSPRFSDSLDSGGIGSSAIKYFSIQVQGFTQGIAHLAVSYTADELNGLAPNSLFLAVRSSDSWQKLDNMEVQTGTNLVLGDLQVSTLQSGPVGALGAGEPSQPTASSSFIDKLNNPRDILEIIGGVFLIIVLITVIVYVVIPRTRRNSK